jgi:drug/metabolite transporter (DMT)-like permease
MYPIHVVLTLLGMITAGAARIVVVKIYFQIELEESRAVTPMFVTLLYLVGQSLSLFVHFIYIRLKSADNQKDGLGNFYSNIEMAGRTLNDDGNSIPPLPEAIDDPKFQLGIPAAREKMIHNDDKYDTSNGDGVEELPFCDDDELPNVEDPSSAIVLRPKLRRQGSKTGLTAESEDAVAWIHRIPWYLKPAIPGFFNLCNSALRWACLVFVAASTAEILISGTELVFSSFAAWIIRKRIISTRRWFGISIVTLGIVLVGFEKIVEKKEMDDEEQRFFIGNMLIFGQCIFSVLQDLSEEIFMQEANFPATLLLGMEGIFGLVFGVPIYLFFFSEDISFTRFDIGYEIGLVILVLITGILNIRTTEVTSSMTRNVWKQFRIILVWIFGLLVYYVGSDDSLGEPWVFPGSFFVLGGFSVILTGVYYYYSD